MALTPDITVPEITKLTIQTSRTYALDIDTGRIKGMVDGRQAIEQFIRKAIFSPRFVHSIYSDAYGCEIPSLIGKGFSNDFLRSEVKRMITEALIYDSRINKVYNFAIKPNGDEIFVSFTVDTLDGVIEIDGVSL